MKNNLRRYILLSVTLFVVVITGLIILSSVHGQGESAITGKAKFLNTNSYLDFNASPYNSNVKLSDPDSGNGNIRTFSGYAWSEDLGWVDFGDALNGGPVTVDYATGALNGRAYVKNTGGFIDFSGNDFYANTVINPTTGISSGYAWSDELGWLDFSDTGIGVADDSPPNNPGSVTGYEDSGLILELISAEGGNEDQWYNYPAPYFSWEVPSDPPGASGYGKGVAGYFVYFGTNPTAIPTSAGEIVNEPNFTADGLVSGETYYLRIQAFDVDNNIFTDVLEEYTFFVYKYDAEEPINPMYISLPGNFVSTREVTFTWPTSGPDAPNDALSGFHGIQYRIRDDNPWYGSLHLPSGEGEVNMNDILVNTGSYTLDETYDQPLLQQGSNIIYIRTLDKAGNVTSEYTTGVLKLNTDAPSSPRSLAVDPGTNTTNAYSFDWQAPSSYVGSVFMISYCYTVNVLPGELNCNFTAAGQLSLSTGAYATQPGTNILYLVAKDEAGNINYETYISVNFVYTGSAPGIVSNFDIADISAKNTQNWRLAVSWDEPGDIGTGIENYRVYRSIKEGAACSDIMEEFELAGTTSGLAYIDTGLEQQIYYYCVSACDSANSCGAVSTTSSKYPDGKYDDPPGLVSGPDVGLVTTSRAAISWYTDRISDTKIQYGLKSDEYFETEAYKSEHVLAHSLALVGLIPDTTYYYRAKWTDEDGNTGVSEEKIFKTNPAPVVKDISVQYVDTSSAIIRFKIVDAKQAKIYYGKTEVFGGLEEVSTSYLESTYSVPISNLEDGSLYFFKINPVDVENMEYNGTILSFETLPLPEITNITIQEIEGAAAPTLSVKWSINTPATSIVSFYPEDDISLLRDTVNLEMIEGEHEAQIIGLIADTKYVLIVKGTDRFGNQAASDLHRFTTATDNRPPLISNIIIEENVQTFEELNEEPTGQVIVSWETDELATAQVEYGEGSTGSYPNSSSVNDILSYKHVVVINDLKPSTAYHLRVKSADGTGNVAVGQDQLVIIPKASGSVIDLIIQTLTDVFSFL